MTEQPAKRASAPSHNVPEPSLVLVESQDAATGLSSKQTLVSEPMLQTEDFICKVCHCTILDNDDLYNSELIAPCRCSGSAKWIHRRCLDEWRQVNKGKKKAYYCEICKQKYNILSIKPSFFAYIRDCWTPTEKFIYCSALLSVLLTIVAAIRTYKFELKTNPGLVSRLPAWKMVFRYYLYGWPLRKKFFMYLCMLLICWGHKFLFEHWRTRNAKEIILASQSKFPLGRPQTTTPIQDAK